MAKPSITLFPSPTSLAHQYIKELEKSISAHSGAFHWAVSGGSTPKLLFKQLAESTDVPFPWQNLHIWWVDERCVPPSHPESNYGVMKELLLDKVQIPSENIHRVEGELTPEEANIRYQTALEHWIPQENGVPQFDSLFLGMGADGHTASIFPGNLELLSSSEWTAVAIHPESGQARVTLTGPVIRQAASLDFIVTGAAKKEMLDNILNKRHGYEAFPASHIYAKSGQLRWLLDESAYP
ncbi:MAG: 6-phosphogluconolactonase [Bacteroidota bacterium]